MVLWYGKVVVVFVRRTLVWCLLVSLAASCKAQSPSSSASTSASPVPTSQLNRRIEVLVRSQFDVPPNVEVTTLYRLCRPSLGPLEWTFQ